MKTEIISLVILLIDGSRKTVWSQKLQDKLVEVWHENAEG
jgi:hypothetical protein